MLILSLLLFLIIHSAPVFGDAIFPKNLLNQPVPPDLRPNSRNANTDYIEIEEYPAGQDLSEENKSPEDSEEYLEEIESEADDVINQGWSELPETEQKEYGSPEGFYEKSTDDVSKETGIYVSKEAFSEILLQGYKPEDIEGAGAWDIIKQAFTNGEIIFQIIKGGKLIALPFKDGEKTGREIMTLGEFKDFIEKSEADFEKRVRGEIIDEKIRTADEERSVLELESGKADKEMTSEKERQTNETAKKKAGLNFLSAPVLSVIFFLVVFLTVIFLMRQLRKRA